jgi:hypothetical protein
MAFNGDSLAKKIEYIIIPLRGLGIWPPSGPFSFGGDRMGRRHDLILERNFRMHQEGAEAAQQQ